MPAYVSVVWADPKLNPNSMAASIKPPGKALDFEIVKQDEYKGMKWGL